MNESVLRSAEEWIAAGEDAALATVVAVRRSAPRPPGAKMAVSASGDVAGMVSGGCVEGAVVQEALAVLEGGPPRLLHFGIADAEAWEVGLPCGGEIDVWVERHAPGSGLTRAALAGDRAARVVAVGGERLGQDLFVGVDGEAAGALEDPEATRWANELMWAEHSELRGELFVDATFPAPRLLIFGAVDYAAALSKLARTCGWRPYVIDPRGFFARPDRFPDAEEVIVGWPEEAVARLGGLDRATSVCVLTHDPKLDDAAVSLALRSEARYVGAMGSRRANEARIERLLELGFSTEDIARIAMPIGLDLGAVTPEETALSIMAELSARRNGRAGGRLRDSDVDRIHEVGAT